MKKETSLCIQKFALSVSLFLVCATSFIEPTTIVFDAGGVLVHTARGGIIKKMMGKFIRYMLFSWKNPSHIKTLTFSVLKSLYGEQVPETGCPCACGDGIELPSIMCDWLAGSFTGSEIIERTCKLLDEGCCDNILSDNREKELIKDILKIIFDSDIHAQNTHPIPEGISLLQDCANEGCHTIMLLSNYATDAFEKIYNNEEMQKAIFSYIKPENLIVSGFIGLIKPYASIFHHLFSRYKLNPSDVIFIDDQEENIQTAQKLGIKTIHLKNKNYTAARAELHDLGVI